jgi:hypothetical protein
LHAFLFFACLFKEKEAAAASFSLKRTGAALLRSEGRKGAAL